MVGLDESNVIPPVKYVKVFSTVVVGLPDLFFFGLDSYKTFPTTIFVSASANDTSPFSSFAIKTWINMTLPSEKEGGLSAVVKIFSPVRLDEGVLEEMFVWRTQTMVKEWFAYPYLTVKKS